MGLGKIIAIIFLILIIILGIIGVDIYLTIDSLSNADVDTLVSNPQYENVGNSTLKIKIDVSLPSAGFIPKGVVLSLTIDADGVKDTETDQIDFGESKTLTLSFTLTDTQKNTLIAGGDLTVSTSAEVTPVYFGFEITQATQEVDLGSTTISG
jgi:hypothetical protein